jgi:hypothetical protein
MALHSIFSEVGVSHTNAAMLAGPRANSRTLFIEQGEQNSK